MKIGITGSLASGKTTASKILSSGKGPLFSADGVVKELYSKNYFNKIIRKKFLNICFVFFIYFFGNSCNFS